MNIKQEQNGIHSDKTGNQNYSSLLHLTRRYGALKSKTI